jgi:hypothetical protein
MTELIEAAIEQQVEVLTLDLRADNTAAIELYESLGFDRYGRLERFVAVGEARYDKLFYALDLRDVAHRAIAQPAESARTLSSFSASERRTCPPQKAAPDA